MAARVPSRLWHAVVDACLRVILPPARRPVVKGDLLELWALRDEAGRRDLHRATVSDLMGLMPVARWRRLSAGSGLGQDIRHALRAWSKRPGTAAALLVVLSLGIGASTAIFTAFDALLIRPLPYPSANRLMDVTNGPILLGFRPGAPTRVETWFTEMPEIAGAGVWQEGGVNLELGIESQRAIAAVVDRGFFDVLGVPPLLGDLLPPSGTPGRFVVVSHGLWRGKLGGDRGVIGRDVSINGQPYEVVGVMPPEFGFPSRADVWLPTGIDYQVTGEVYAPNIVARLAAGLSRERAEAAARAGADRQREAEGRRQAPPDRQLTMTPLTERVSRPVRSTVMLLSVTVGLLLLVVCVSAANILLARVAGRSRELQVRRALGASQWRITRGLLIESLLIVSAGALAGVWLAAWFTSGIAALVPPILRESLTVGWTSRLLGIGVGMTVLVALLTGLGPAWLVAGKSGSSVVRSGRDDTTGRTGHRVRSGLVVVQMTLALVLLAASAAALSSLLAAARVPLGFGGTESIVMQVTLPRVRFGSTEAIAGYIDRALAALTAAPGVRQAGATSLLPDTAGVMAVSSIRKDWTSSDDEPVWVEMLSASPGYFEAMGIRRIAGRGFDRTDRPGAPPVVMLSEPAARRVFGRPDQAIGAPVVVDKQEYVVIGVVAGVHRRDLSLTLGDTSQMYLPIAQAPPYGGVSFVVESLAAAEGVRAAVDALGRVDTSVPVHSVRALADIESQFLASYRVTGTLVTAFAIVTLIVAAVGLYGLLSQVVSERLREIGIRLALGASAGQVGRRVLSHALRLAAIGIVCGIGATLLGFKTLNAIVPSLERAGTGMLAINAATLLIVTMLAAWLPAARARRVDPARVLRDEV